LKDESLGGRSWDDPTGAQDRIAGTDSLPRIPEVSGVIHPRKQRLSDSYFKLVGETWIPQVIDDPEFPARVLSGGQSVGWHLQEQCIARILFESGCRVTSRRVGSTAFLFQNRKYIFVMGAARPDRALPIQRTRDRPMELKQAETSD